MLPFWLAMVALIGALNYAMPQLGRRDIFFSVTVAPEFRATAPARAILAGYRRGIIMVTAIALVVAVAVLRPDAGLAGADLLMLELLAALGVFVVAHRKTIAYASIAPTAREASLAPQPRLAGVGLLLLGPYLMLMCAAWLMRAHWNEIPDPMPVHWDIAGNPNGWMPKTPMIFWGLLGSEFALCMILTFSVVAMLYFSRQIAASGVNAIEERRLRWIGIAVLVAGSFLSATLAFMPLYPHATLAFGGVAFLLIVMVVGALELVRRGQGGVRLAPATRGLAISDRTPDECWKWGMIYYNPADPALMVEKRFGIGWTLNFAHRGAWILMVLMLVVVAFSLSMPLLARYR